jgi:hypothetical protein
LAGDGAGGAASNGGGLRGGEGTKLGTNVCMRRAGVAASDVMAILEKEEGCCVWLKRAETL